MMNAKRILVYLLTGLVLLNAAGCRKAASNSNAQSASLPAPGPETVVRVHWQGKDQLGLKASAYYFYRILNMPATASLQSQTLDKLSTLPWRVAEGERGRTNSFAILLRPLLDDVVQNECYFELRQAAKGSEECVFAIRLRAARGGVWTTNLANVMASLCGDWPIASPRTEGWILARSVQPDQIELCRAGEWLLFSVAQKQSAFLQEVKERLRRRTDPFGSQWEEYWLVAHLDLKRLSIRIPGALGLSSSEDWPVVSLSLTGDGGNVLTHAVLDFPQALNLELEAWNPPVAQIAEPLVGFALARGVQPWLASLPLWQQLQLGSGPNQVYWWVPDGLPLQMVIAAPHTGASTAVDAITRNLVAGGNDWLSLHATGQFESFQDSRGVIWSGLPGLSPFVRSVASGSVILAAMEPAAGQGTNTQSNINLRPALSEMLDAAAGQTNLVCLHWELTSPQVESWLFLGNIFRQVFHRPALDMNSVGVEWLRMVKDRLANSTTHVRWTAPSQITIDRKSTIGLTGAELVFLVGWLESPKFP